MRAFVRRYFREYEEDQKQTPFFFVLAGQLFTFDCSLQKLFYMR